MDKDLPHWFDWEAHQSKRNSRDSFFFQWRAT